MSACGRKSQWSISVEFFARKLDLEVDLETGPVQKDSKTPLLASFMVEVYILVVAVANHGPVSESLG